MPGRIEKEDKITRFQSKNDNTTVLPLTWKKNGKNVGLKNRKIAFLEKSGVSVLALNMKYYFLNPL